MDSIMNIHGTDQLNLKELILLLERNYGLRSAGDNEVKRLISRIRELEGFIEVSAINEYDKKNI
jgi:hypothetical protein